MSSTPMSVYSDLGYRPPVISCFNWKALIKDKQLRARMLEDDRQIADPLRAVSYDSNAPIGVQQSSGELDHLVVDSYKISCQSASGPLDPEADYVGMVLYSKDGTVDWHLNGVHCKSGYIYFKKTTDIEHLERDHGQVHDKLYVSLFGEKPSDNVVASGFTIRQGLKWRFNSGTWQKQRHMGRSERKIVKAAIKRFVSDGLLASTAMITEQMDQLLMHESQSRSPAQGSSRDSSSDRRFLHKATVNISARCKWNTRRQFACLCTCLVPYRTERNSISIHITWKRGSKQKSVSMRKSIHCMCYQLLLDIEAHTGKKASKHVLLHHGVELPLRENIGNAGVCDGDILMLQRTPASPSALPSNNHTTLGYWSQRQLKLGGLPTVVE